MAVSGAPCTARDGGHLDRCGRHLGVASRRTRDIAVLAPAEQSLRTESVRFLTLCVLSVLLFTRPFSASFDRPLPQFLAGTVCLLFAVVCWWWFCQGFPQRFFDEPLPENIEMPWILRMHGKMPRTVDYSVTFSSHRIFLLALLAFSGVVWAIDGEVRPNSFYLLPILISWGGNMLRRNYALSGAGDRRKILWILEGSFLLILLYGAGQSAGLLFWIIKGANGGALTYR